jgi:SAM-dependent methyltransferase
MLNRILNKMKLRSLARFPAALGRRVIGGLGRLRGHSDPRPDNGHEPVPTLETPGYVAFQETPQKVLRRYVSLKGKDILEIGGSQSCISAKAFLRDGARSVTVTGLDHITEETMSTDQGIKIARVNGLELAKHFGPSQFDIVFGLSIIEHIPDPRRFMEQVHYVLKPGGFAYFEGNPLWSSPKGHHLWVPSWGGNYMGKTSASYLFTELAGTVSTNPVPDWGHLLLGEEELTIRLRDQSIPESDITCIAHWIYSSDEINRLSFSEISEAYTNSALTTLEACIYRVDVPDEMLQQLRRKHGDSVDYGVTGITYVLRKQPNGDLPGFT